MRSTVYVLTLILIHLTVGLKIVSQQIETYRSLRPSDPDCSSFESVEYTEVLFEECRDYTTMLIPEYLGFGSKKFTANRNGYVSTILREGCRIKSEIVVPGYHMLENGSSLAFELATPIHIMKGP
ncbi:MAG: hypothetical protein MHPSP_004132, partial [Paramarteilia canceri]